MARLTPDRFLFRHSAAAFAVFAAFAVVAFWPRYYGVLFDAMPARVHWHGIVMTLWLAALVAQAWLIRRKNYAVHRWIGRASYVLAPLVVITGVVMTRGFLGRQEPGTDGFGFDLALMLLSLVAFSILYGLAIWFRKNRTVHARLMAATVFPMVTPVTDRLIANHARGLFGVLPTVDGGPAVPVAGFVIVDLLLVALVVWDWRTSRRAGVFAGVLALVLAYHVSVLTLYRSDAWDAVGAWFVALPLG